MSDPAVSAAQRAWDETDGFGFDSSRDAMVAAAREALAPIRELIEKWEAPTTPGVIHNGAPESLTNIAQDFIDSLRELVYPSEELT